MRQVQRARECLVGRLPTAIALETTLLAAHGVLLLLELLLLRGVGLPIERIISFTATDQRTVMYLVLTVISWIVHRLLLSPMYLGRADFYWRISQGQSAPFSLLFAYYRSRPRQYPHPWRVSMDWQWGQQWRQWVYGILCLLPAAAALGYADIVQRGAQNTLSADIKLLLCRVAAIILLGGGWVVYQLVKLRYTVVPYVILRQNLSCRGAFRQATHLTQRHIHRIGWLYLRFSGWFALCLLILPLVYVAPLFQTTRCVTLQRCFNESKG